MKLAVFMGPYRCNLKACVFEHLVLTALFGKLMEPLWGVWLVEAGWPLRVMGQLSSSHVFLGLAALEKVLPHMPSPGTCSLTPCLPHCDELNPLKP